MYVGLGMYFRADDSYDAGLVGAFLRRLHSIESWFNAQSSYCFIASSLLFVYDGDAVRRPSPNHLAKSACSSSLSHNSCFASNETTGNCSDESVKSDSNGYFTAEGSYAAAATNNEQDSYWEEHVTLKMIDFTHAFPVSSPDENYLTGLRSLIGYMMRLKPGMYEPDP